VCRTLCHVNDPTPSPAGSTDTSVPCGSSPANCGSSPGTCGSTPAACGSSDAEPAGEGLGGPAQSEQPGCCGGEADAAASLSQARKTVVATGVIGLALALTGLILGGWVGFLLVAVVAAGIGSALARSWSRLSANDRLIRLAVLALLAALALVRALPR
ncbi:MAG: hypothetical protein ABI746_10820, partial [Dermatophilaceae bacterium]